MVYYSYVWCDAATHSGYQTAQHSNPEVNTEEARYQIIVALMRVCTNGRLRKEYNCTSIVCLPVMHVFADKFLRVPMVHGIAVNIMHVQYSYMFSLPSNVSRGVVYPECVFSEDIYDERCNIFSPIM